MQLTGNAFSPPGCMLHVNIPANSVELGGRASGKCAQFYRRLQAVPAPDKMSHRASWPVASDAGGLVAGHPVR